MRESISARLPRPSGTLFLHVAVVVALLVIPFVLVPFQVMGIMQILLVAMAVLGLNLLTGFTGQISVGHSAFFGVGAYATAILLSHSELGMGGAIVFAVAFGAATGALVGIPSLRIKGTSLAIVTLVMAAVFPSLVRSLDELTGGTQGIQVPRITAPPGGPLATDQLRYLVVLAILLLLALAILCLDRSRWGRALRALGDNELAAVTLGIRAARLRVAVFTASAAITSLAGAMFAVTSGFVSSGTSFITIVGSIQFLTALVVGGRAILLGPLLGALVVELIPVQIGQTSPEWAQLIYGVTLIAILLVAPAGLTGWRGRTLGRLLKRNTHSIDSREGARS